MYFSEIGPFSHKKIRDFSASRDMQIIIPSHIHISGEKIRVKMNVLLKKKIHCYAMLHYSMGVTYKGLMEKILAIV